MRLTGAEIIVRALADLGVEVVFGYPGGAVLPIYDAIFRQNRVRHILVRHEQAAVHMAEGYARSTGRIGVVLVTSGPGATNTVTGLTDALMDSVPVLCLTGQVPTHLIGNDAFQEADTVGITRSCTKHNYLIKDIRQLVPVLTEAYTVAAKGRPGPVVVDLPKDVQNAELTYVAPACNAVERYRPKERPAAPQVRAALDLLLRAKRPIIYAGGGVVNSGPAACRSLTRLVRETGFPVTTTLMGLGAVPASEPNFLGMLGMHGTYEANMAMHDCDVMLNVGARFDDRVTGRLDAFSPASKKIVASTPPASTRTWRSTCPSRATPAARSTHCAAAGRRSDPIPVPTGSTAGGGRSGAGRPATASSTRTAASASSRNTHWNASTPHSPAVTPT